MQLLTGFLLAIAVSYAAYRAHSLSLSGAIAAVLTGTLIFGVGGWQWAVLLLAFFVSSSALTRAFKKRKTGLNEKYSKGGQRDAAQVFGNGGLAAMFAALHYSFPDSAWVWLAFAASLAAVNADTWATELGVLSPHSPRMITNPAREVEKGTSGGVTLVGTLAALAGAGLIGLLAVLVAPSPTSAGAGLLVTLAGLSGALFDSLLGATVQAIYQCPSCNKETERHPTHTCGSPTVLKRGWRWLDNDMVNLGCAVFAVLLVIMVYRA
jgi:uncharacterized protein (TIGR00297 family)